MKKVFAIIMSAMMLVCFMPAMAFAGETTEFIANKADEDRDWNSVGKFRVELQTPAYSDRNIQLEDATAYAEVYEDYSVYAHLNNDSVNGHSVQAKVAMRNVESLGCAGQTKTHPVGPFEANMNRSFKLQEYFPNIMGFRKATIAGSVNGNAFSYEISDFALKEGTTKERVLTATPDNTENVRAAWKELTNQVTTKSYDSDDSMVVIPAGAYLQIGTQKLTFDKPYTINPSKDGVGNLEGGIRDAASLDENAATLKDGATVALYVPKDSVLRVGQSEAKLNHALLITSDVVITNMTVNLKELKASEQLGLVKNLFTFVDNAFGCFSGTTGKSINVLSEYVVKYGNQEAKVFHGKTFTLPAADSGYKWVDANDKNKTVNAGKITVTGDMTLTQEKITSSGGGGGGFVPMVPTETPLDKAKAEANTAVKAAGSANKYDEAEQAEVKKILDKAEADIKAAKTEDEVKKIQEAAQAEIDKVLTSEENAQIKALSGVDKDIFKAKSKYSKLRGKRAVKITWNVPKGMKLDGYEVFRSTKKYSGFGTKPYFTTSKTSYVNNKGLVKGKTYYYKVRGFVEINGERYYTGFSIKAFRTIK